MLKMNSNSTETHEALKKLLNALSCSLCNTNLHMSKQFLKCGHILCIPCTRKKKVDCTQCQVMSNKNKNSLKYIEKIVQICCNVAEIVGYSIDTLTEKKKINAGISSSIILKNSKKKRSKKLKHIKNIDNEPSPKKIKYEIKSNKVVRKNINKRNHHGETMLQKACKKGQKECIKTLLEAGADPNIPCYANWTPLQETADYGYYEITEILLESGANVNQHGYEGRTALHEAAKNNDFNMINLLLKYNARKDLLDSNKKRPIDYCTLDKLKTILNIGSKTQYHNESAVNVRGNKSSVIANEANDNDFYNVQDKSIIKKKEVDNNCLISKKRSKIDNNINDIENEINVVFENIGNNIDIDCFEESNGIKDSILYDSEHFIDIISVCDSEKNIFVDNDLESIQNICSEDSVIPISIDSEEIIDVIN